MDSALRLFGLFYRGKNICVLCLTFLYKNNSFDSLGIGPPMISFELILELNSITSPLLLELPSKEPDYKKS